MTFIIVTKAKTLDLYNRNIKFFVMATHANIRKEKTYRLYIQEQYQTLKKYRSVNDRTGFYNTMVRLLPELRNYVTNLLNEVIHKGNLPHNFYEVGDFIDDLFISVYEHFESLKTEENFYLFIFEEIDSLLDKAQFTENKHHQSTEHIDAYAKKERDALRERFTAELDGDLIMREELDDISYRSSLENLMADLIEENDQSIDDKIDTKTVHIYQKEHINELINSFDPAARNIATLYVHFHLTIPEIVKVTKSSHQEVDKIIKHVKQSLKQALFNT